jgi:Protein of unknown function (DUF3147)
MRESLVRFVIGGTVVSIFAILGDLFKPKSFAGLFGAAPSVALATLTMTVANDGRWYAAREARSMIAGAIAFFMYASLVSSLTMRHTWKALPVASASIFVWLGLAFALWRLCLR